MVVPGNRSIFTFILHILLCAFGLVYGNNLSQRDFDVCNSGCAHTSQNDKNGLSASFVKIQHATIPMPAAARAAYRDRWTVKAIFNATDLAPRDPLALITGTGFTMGIAQWDGTVIGSVAYVGPQCMVRGNKRAVDCIQLAGDGLSRSRVTMTEIGHLLHTFGNKFYKVQASIRAETVPIPVEDQRPLRILLRVGDVLFVDHTSLPCTVSGNRKLTLTCRL